MIRKTDKNRNSSSEDPSGHRGVKKRGKRIVAAAITAAAAIATAAVLYIFFINKPAVEAGDSVSVIYAKEGEVYLRTGKSFCELDIADDFLPILSKDGTKLFYISKGSKDNRELLRFDLNDKSHFRDGGTVVDTQVANDILPNYDGSAVLYSKRAENEPPCVRLYDFQSLTSVQVTDEIKQAYILPRDNIVYFTRPADSNKALYKYVFGREPKKIATNTARVEFYKSAEAGVLIYETSVAGSPYSELFVINGPKEPEFVSAEVVSVRYEDYRAGGNLYYFKNTEKNAAWTDIVPDTFQVEDAKMTQPKKDDYLSFFGISFEYNQAYKEYQNKLLRDSFRAKLDEIVKEGNLISEPADCYVFKDSASALVETNVIPENIIAVSNGGSPKIIFQKSIYTKSDTSLESLAETLSGSSDEEIKSYLLSIIKQNTVVQGAFIKFAGAAQSIGLNMQNDDKATSSILFAENGKMFYTLIKDMQGEKYTAYETTSDGNGISESRPIDVNITSYDILNDGFRYLKTEPGEQKSALYSYRGGESVKLLNNVNAFSVLNENGLLAFANRNGAGPETSVDLAIFVDDKIVLSEQGTALSQIKFQGRHVAYLRKLSQTNSGELCVFNGARTMVVDQNVTDVLLVNG